MTDKDKLAKLPKISKLSTESYKGVRDFFPEDMAVEKAIFGIWRNVAEKYGYEEYAASVLEPAELYRAKSGEEIVNEQTYTFIDRGDREVTLRPEMTPTVARMVAARRRGLTFPVRWYSIPNLFRYEQPQRGRLREHWQLNVDIFGVESLAAEFEIISMAYDITRGYGLADKDFEIRINSRALMNEVMKDEKDGLGLDEAAAHKLSKLVDKKAKMPGEKFASAVGEIISDTEKKSAFMKLLEVKTAVDLEKMKIAAGSGVSEASDNISQIRTIMGGLKKLGIENARFDPTLMRGFDYYTGIVFEIFDIDPKNRRSVFGGGRYDDLLSLFGNDKVTAVGFGAGDVVARDLMETHGTLEKITEKRSPAEISIALMDGKTGEETDGTHEYAFKLAKVLRDTGVRVSVDLSNKKTGDKIACADKQHIPFVIVLGLEEVKSDQIVLKNLATKEEKLFGSAEYKDIGNYIRDYLKKS
jgi:histidyl-tRNA synthetase